MSRTIYRLQLHETLAIDGAFMDLRVTRVAGGWLYQHIYSTGKDEGIDERVTTTFVPYHEEFKHDYINKAIREKWKNENR